MMHEIATHLFLLPHSTNCASIRHPSELCTDGATPAAATVTEDTETLLLIQDKLESGWLLVPHELE